MASITPKEKLELQKSIINDFKEAGIQPDLGTISGNSLIARMQDLLTHSTFTGSKLESFKKKISENVVSSYKKISGELGESIYENRHEAGQALKTGLEEARANDVSIARDLYQSAKKRGGQFQVFTGNIVNEIKKIKSELEPGSFKSGEQKTVLDILDHIEQDVLTKDGGIKGASIEALINDKIALNDVINYEVQGGAKKLLGQLVGQLDKAIKSHGAIDPTFAREWTQANVKFSQHAKTFRGKAIANALRTEDAAAVFQKMNTPHGIIEIKKALRGTPEGRELYKNLAAHKLEDLIGKNLVDGVSNQLNFGKFSKLLEKNQNRHVVGTLIGSDRLKQLENLQKATGRIADSAQKFLNTSKTSYVLKDLAIAAKLLIDVGHVLAGNPWPLSKSAGGILLARKAAKLMTDPEFLSLVEDAIKESGNPNSQPFKNIGFRLAKKAKDLEEPVRAAAVMPTPHGVPG